MMPSRHVRQGGATRFLWFSTEAAPCESFASNPDYENLVVLENTAPAVNGSLPFVDMLGMFRQQHLPNLVDVCQ